MKVLKYWIVIFLIIQSLNIRSQVIYTELNPTIKLPDNTEFKIDFNSDNIPDVMIHYGGYKSNPGCPATIYSMIGFSAASDTISVIKNSQENIIFNNFDSFQNLIYSTCIYSQYPTLPWSKIVVSTKECSGGVSYLGIGGAITNKYFVVKFKVNGKYHYGWIKFSKSSGVNLEIKSFAYHTSPDTPFTINDPQPTSIQEVNINNKISIFPNPFKNEINISSKDAAINTISLHDILGNLIYLDNNISKEVKINTTSLPKGIYLVKINIDNKILSKYIIK